MKQLFLVTLLLCVKRKVVCDDQVCVNIYIAIVFFVFVVVDVLESVFLMDICFWT